MTRQHCAIVQFQLILDVVIELLESKDHMLGQAGVDPLIENLHQVLHMRFVLGLVCTDWKHDCAVVVGKSLKAIFLLPTPCE